MQNVKQQVQTILEKLPDDCSFEDVQYRLYIAETIQKRLEMAGRGEFVSQEQAEKRMEKWLPK